MRYNICLVKNRFNEKIDIQRYAIDWFKAYANLDIEFNVIETDFDVTTKKIGNHKFSGVIVGDDIVEKLRTVIPEHKYNAVVFLYGNDLNGIRVSTVNGGGNAPLYPDTELIQVCKSDDSGRTINHELFHAFFFKAKKCQINIVDNMDTYLRDTDLTVNNVIDTNREVALQTLKPHWNKICAFRNLTPIVTINRISDDGVQTLGNLIYDNFRCKTLERPYKNNKLNISSIPKGTYTCKYTFSPKFLKYTYELQNTKPRTGIRIHSGNYFFDIQGCILLGDSYSDINKDGKVDILNSRKTIAEFERLMNKQEFTLIIN